jgi:hypothetical protein
MVAGLAAALGAFAPASAANLVANGGFETTVGGGPNIFLDTGEGALGSWSGGSSTTAIYAPGAADTTGAEQGAGTYIYLWGPNLPSPYAVANGLTATSPAGGNYLAMDADSDFATAVTQMISGLTPGGHYDLSFYYAAAQYARPGYGVWYGATQTGIQASIGADTFNAPQLAIASQGFSGWKHETYEFTASSTSELLSLLATSANHGVPPVALLDGVSITYLPEPSAWAMMIVGTGLLGAVARRRRAQAPAH